RSQGLPCPDWPWPIDLTRRRTRRDIIVSSRCCCNAREDLREPVEDHMPTFILTLNWTEQGIRAVKDAPKRSQDAKELAKKLSVEVKQVYLTSGERDLLLI